MARNHAAMRIATYQAQLLGTIVLDRGDAYDLELPFTSFSASIQTAFTPAELRASQQQRVHGIGVLVHDNLDREYHMSLVYRNELWRLQGDGEHSLAAITTVGGLWYIYGGIDVQCQVTILSAPCTLWSKVTVLLPHRWKHGERFALRVGDVFPTAARLSVHLAQK